jgi:ABC-type uncharacterized transport system permease subunit
VSREGARRVALELGSSLVAVAIGLGISLLLIVLAGKPAGAAARTFIDGSFGSTDELAATATNMVPLILVALGWIVAVSGGLFNVGLDGQIVVGGLVATELALAISLPTGLHLVVAVLASAVAGAAYAGIAAALWAWRGANEIVSTLMLNFVAIQILSWAVRSPLKDPTQQNARSAEFPHSAWWPQLVPDAGLNWDLVLAVAMAAVVGMLLAKTTFGFGLRLTAANEAAARSAGTRTSTVRAIAMLCSGGLGGLAGASLILGGQSHSLTDGFNATWGYDGIAVALVARNNPWACLPSALLFAALRQGGSVIETSLSISSSLVLVTQGIVIAVVAAAIVLSRRIRSRRVDVEPSGKNGGSALESSADATT